MMNKGGDMMLLKLLFLFFVYLGIFLFGMFVMRAGLYNLSGEHVKQWLLRFAGNPMKGLLTGTIVTAIIHSSSAVMVLTVGLVATGYLTFKQSIGIILGANIGTTFTAEFIAFDIYEAAVPSLLAGAFLLFMRNKTLFCLGSILFGMGCLFTSMQGFEQLAGPISSIPSINALLTSANENKLTGIGIGTILTAIIQSSTATTGIIMSFLNGQTLELEAGIAILLGANIGTCITAILASIGSSKAAKLTSYAHVWLNLLGVVLIYPFIQILARAAELLTTSPDMQIAHVSVMFNVLTSFLMLPFVGIFSSFIMKIHGKI
jgi:phosphate:Na+ symporter